VKYFIYSLLVVSLVFATASMAPAVIISGGDGSGNATESSAVAGAWSYVGKIGNSSGVYLGDGWVITAYHVQLVSPGTMLLKDKIYNVDASTFVRLTDPNNSSKPADLCMVRLNTADLAANPVGLDRLAVSTTTPTADLPITAIGYGFNRATGLTMWDVTHSGSTYTWTETTNPLLADASGYKWDTTGNKKRWGTNNVTDLGGGNTVITVNDGFGTTSMFTTTFDSGISSNEMQVADRDSGGGAFYKNIDDDSWELAGILLTRDTYSGQPTHTAVYGNSTYMADLSIYAGQIATVIATTAPLPEPGSLSLLLVGGVSALLVWRRRAAKSMR
jgi:hypothetical protein